MNNLPIGTNYCLCSGCGLYFKSVSAFEAHRVGSGANRRCLGVTEMSERGFAPNAKGYWRKLRVVEL